MEVNKFNVRVYGLLINALSQVLICEEKIKGILISKFPGGGLEFGEGTIECLRREFIEETGNEIEIVSHFYTTDFFQVSAYNSAQQIISIYYLVKPTAEFIIETKEQLLFKWVEIKSISDKDLTLPIDKHVGEMLREIYEC